MISHRDDNKEQLAEALRQWRLGDSESQASSPHKGRRVTSSKTLQDLCVTCAAKALAAGNTKIFERAGILVEDEVYSRILQVSVWFYPKKKRQHRIFMDLDGTGCQMSADSSLLRSAGGGEDQSCRDNRQGGSDNHVQVSHSERCMLA
jgi:hypothetical protein